VLFAIQTQREWHRFCHRVIDAPSLEADSRFATNRDRLANRDALEGLIEASFRAQPRSAVIARLEAADIPTGAVNDVPAVVAHPQLAARGRWASTTVGGAAAPALVPPHNIMGAPARLRGVPSLGEHTAQVLAELRAMHDAGGSR
jgi:crotonobetainyl-CoA:carnitine CoA-transferase CaiB-like acyl-CoA transferase